MCIRDRLHPVLVIVVAIAIVITIDIVHAPVKYETEHPAKETNPYVNGERLDL